jgi:two-component system chemotaxis response regulator CheB
MPPKFTTLLAASIRDTTGHDCREARDGDALVPGQVLLAPGDFHMEIRRLEGVLRVSLNQNPPENWCRPAVDPLFRSAAETLGSKVFAVVLTGMGEDGRRGAQAISEKSGAVYVQDEASSVVWGMPGAVARAGLAREILPIPELVSRATRWLIAAGANSQVVHRGSSVK